MKRENWEIKKFEDCINKVIYTNKIQKINFLTKGIYPIISQEEGKINGFWDDENDVFKIRKPIVVFGDHTRVLKYVDFDFVLGADGVKILEPIDDINSKFFFYFLTWFKLPSLGYSRHYKLLKELSIPVPPLSVQEAIVKELDTLHRLRELQEEQLTEYENLAQSTFYSMFGDPVENDKGWKMNEFGNLFTLKSGQALSAKNIIRGDYPVYGGNGVVGYHSEFNLEGDNIIIGRVGALCGNIRWVNNKVWLTDNAFQLISKVELNDFKYTFLQYILTIIDLRRYAREALQPVISNTTLKKINMIIPPLSLQNQFAERIEKIEKQKELVKKSIEQTQMLIDYTMDKYFG